MNAIKDGGPAFPLRDCQHIDGDHYGEPGMTLRDYATVAFAAAWVAALANRRDEAGYSDEDAACEANRLATYQAKAMLATREAQP